MHAFRTKFIKPYWIISMICGFVFLLSFLLRPHGCDTAYGPAPYYYNTDLTLWLNLAENPLTNLDSHILANRPLFAFLGWVVAQPIETVLGDRSVASPTRADGVIRIAVSTVAGVMLANFFCFCVTSILLYHFTLQISEDQRAALLSSVLWSTSAFAFAWVYHPVNQMPGLLVLFCFSLMLLRLNKESNYFQHISIGLVIGILLLAKAYYVLPFIYLIWGIFRRYRPVHLLLGFILFFLPTLLWRQIYEAYIGKPFVDYHLGEAGIVGFLFGEFSSLPNLLLIFQKSITNLMLLPHLWLFPAGPIIALISLAFYLDHRYRRIYKQLFVYTLIYIPFFFAFLTLSGFFIPRHGSDFFPLIFPASSIFIADRLPTLNKIQKIIWIAGLLLFTAITYTQPWICTADFM